MRFPFGGFICFWLLTGAVQAAPFKPASLFDPSALSQHTLPNGVRGVVRVSPGSGLICAQVWVRSGSRHEGQARNGASRMLAEAGLLASKNYPRRADAAGNTSGGVRDALESLGGEVKVFTARDSTFFSATLPSRFLPQTLRALSDAVLRPALDETTVGDARDEVTSDQRRRSGDALEALQDIAFRVAFDKHPYRNPASGTPQTLDSLGSANLRTFHQQRFVGPNISVVVTGDAPAATAHGLFAQFFAGAPAAGPEGAPIAPETQALQYKSVSRRFPTINKIVTLAFRAPGIAAPDDVLATDMLLAHWKEGSGAKLRGVLLGPDNDDDVKNEGAPALGFDVDFLTQRDPGLLTISLVVSPRQGGASQAVGLVLDEIEKVRQVGLSPDDLARARAALHRQYMVQSDTLSGQASALGFYEMIGDYRFATGYLDRVDKVTSDDVKRMARKYLSRTGYVQVVAEPVNLPQEGPGGTGSANTLTAELHISGR